MVESKCHLETTQRRKLDAPSSRYLKRSWNLSAWEMYVAEVPFKSNVVVNTLFGRRDRRQVALSTRLGEEINELWNVRKVRDWLSLMG